MVSSSPVHASLASPPQLKFDPGRSYFARLADKVAPGSLLEPTFKRFPFQPALPAYHPAVESGYLLRKGERGLFFLVSSSRRFETDFFRHARLLAWHRDVRARIDHREHEEEKIDERFTREQILAERLRSQSRFEKRAKQVSEQRHIFLDLLDAAYHRSKLSTDQRVEEHDRRAKWAYKLFWAAVAKNLEKDPRPTNVAGSNVASLLAGLPYEKEKSRIIQAVRRIKKNIELSHSEQLLERMAGNSLPETLYTPFVRSFHRPSFEKKLRQETKERLYDESLALHLFELERKREASEWRRMENCEAIDQRMRRHLAEVSKRRLELLLPLPFSALNKQALLSLFPFKRNAAALYALHHIAESQILAYAVQISEHTDTRLPHLPVALHVRQSNRDRLERKSFEEAVARHTEHRRLLLERAEDRHARDTELLIRGDRRRAAARLAYTEAVADLHGIIRGQSMLTESNTNAALRRMRRDAPVRALQAFAEAKRQNGTRPYNPVTATTDESQASFHADIRVERRRHPIPQLQNKLPEGLRLTPGANLGEPFAAEFAWQVGYITASVAAAPSSKPPPAAAGVASEGAKAAGTPASAPSEQEIKDNPSQPRDDPKRPAGEALVAYEEARKHFDAAPRFGGPPPVRGVRLRTLPQLIHRVIYLAQTETIGLKQEIDPAPPQVKKWPRQS